MEVIELSALAQAGIVILATAVRYWFERLLTCVFKAAKIESTSIQIFAKSIVMIVLNVVSLLLFGLLTVNLVAFVNVGRGLIFIATGLVIALIISLLSYFAIKAGYGHGYETLLVKSPTDRFLMWITFLILIGPAEDLFFLGFAQNLLLEQMGLWSIVAYVVLFTLYHYANVLSGVEKRDEFLSMLPVRLLVATLLAVSFYATRSLIYGFIIHNAIDTFSYVALMSGVKQIKKEGQSV